MNFTSVDAIKKILKTEGGFVNNPSDRGGPTNWGITQATYNSYMRRSSSIEEIKNMSKETASDIYKKIYWDYIGGDLINNYAVAYAIFDQYVNRGKYGIMQAQKALGTYPDGKMSQELLNRINNSDPDIFLIDFLDIAEENYRKIASNDPTQLKFLEGWLNRVQGLRDYTDNLLSSIGEVTEKVKATIQDNPWIYLVPIIAIGGVVTYYYLNKEKSHGTKLVTV